MPPVNSAAWLVTKRARPLEVKEAPYTAPGPGELVVKNGAVAVNPVDWGVQRYGNVLLSYLRYPVVLGGDVAGEVVEVGDDVRRFRVGDRVLGMAVGAAPDANRAAEGAFQLYTVVREPLAAAIPDWVSYEQACMLPLTLSTAAYGLFHRDFLALNPPVVPPPATDGGSRALIVTGGASSVGCNAIQLAVSAGYQVYSTASPKNFALVERLGAIRVFDYHSATWVDDMVSALDGRTLAGAYAIGNGSVEGCIDVLRRCRGAPGSNKFVAFAGYPWPAELPTTTLGTLAFFGSTMLWMGSTAVRSTVKGVKAKFIDGKEICQADSVVSRLVYQDFLPRALAAKQFLPAPEPFVVGQGLEKIQEAIEVQAKGVSAQKVVVSL